MLGIHSCALSSDLGVAIHLLGEILDLASDLFPRNMCAKLCGLPSVVATASNLNQNRRVQAMDMVNELSLRGIGLDFKVHRRDRKRSDETGGIKSSFHPFRSVREE